MSERKKQVWFRPDQAELVVESLKYLRANLKNDNSLTTGAERVAKRFTTNRLNEILELFGEKDTP